MKKTLAILALAACLQAGPAHAATVTAEESYDPREPRVTTPWYGSGTAAQTAADIAFIGGMRPHHAGALSMSREYLANKKAENAQLQQLARGIIHNQTFEIMMLDTVEKRLAALHPQGAESVHGIIAERGLAQRERFIRAAMPGPFDAWAGSKDMSAEDVRFAKAMITHHEAALDMAHAYLDDKNADNGYLRLMCLDILRDQKQEIAFMQSLIKAYKGNPDAIKVTPSMVHGMSGMKHAHPAPAPGKDAHAGMHME